MEVRGSEVQDQLWLSIELEINMGLFTGNVYVKGSFLALLPNNFQIFRMSPDHFCRAGVIDTIFLGSEINLRIFNLSTVLMTHLLRKRDIFTIVFSLGQDFDWQMLWYWTEQKKKKRAAGSSFVWVSVFIRFHIYPDLYSFYSDVLLTVLAKQYLIELRQPLIANYFLPKEETHYFLIIPRGAVREHPI